MATKIHRDALRGELASVQTLIDRLDPSDRLGAISLRKRLNILQEELAAIEHEVRNVANVALVFDGGPVKGSSAIDADFAGQALQDYQELLTKIVSSADIGRLAERGPVLLRHQNQARMNVTALVHGSFGFVLEEDGADQAQMFESPTRRAVSDLTDLLSGLVSEDHRWFDEKVQDLDIRVFQSLRRFVETLHRAHSTLKLAEEDRELSLDISRVERAHQRVTQVDIEEDTEALEGELLGIVPIQRRFDFRRNDNGEFLSGRVSENLSADYLERIEREEIMAGKVWRAVILTKTVRHPDGRHASISRLLIDLLEA